MKTSLVAAGLASAIFVTSVSAEVPKAAVPKISVQLHSVKHEIDKDFEKTLKAISIMGFDGVEFAGRFGSFKDSPKKLKEFLDELGLQVSGAHVPIHVLRGEKLANTVSFYQTLGTDTLIIPHDERVDDPQNIAELAQELTILSERLNALGMKLGYHNHAKEFATYENSTYWDYLAEHTPQSFILQLDVGWANFANADPIAYVKKYPNRTLTTHYKIRTQPNQQTSVILGEDKFAWAELINTNIQYGSTEWIVIEQEEYPINTSPLAAIQASKNNIATILQSL